MYLLHYALIAPGLPQKSLSLDRGVSFFRRSIAAYREPSSSAKVVRDGASGCPIRTR